MACKISEERKKKIQELYIQGYSNAEIMRMLRTSRDMIYRVCDGIKRGEPRDAKKQMSDRFIKEWTEVNKAYEKLKHGGRIVKVGNQKCVR